MPLLMHRSLTLETHHHHHAYIIPPVWFIYIQNVLVVPLCVVHVHDGDQHNSTPPNILAHVQTPHCSPLQRTLTMCVGAIHLRRACSVTYILKFKISSYTCTLSRPMYITFCTLKNIVALYTYISIKKDHFVYTCTQFQPGFDKNVSQKFAGNI